MIGRGHSKPFELATPDREYLAVVLDRHPRDRRRSGAGIRGRRDRPQDTARPVGPGTLGFVSDKVWTAEELERLSPAEQDALFESSITTDLAKVPAEFLERVRGRERERISDELNQS